MRKSREHRSQVCVKEMDGAFGIVRLHVTWTAGAAVFLLGELWAFRFSSCMLHGGFSTSGYLFFSYVSKAPLVNCLRELQAEALESLLVNHLVKCLPDIDSFAVTLEMRYAGGCLSELRASARGGSRPRLLRVDHQAVVASWQYSNILYVFEAARSKRSL